MRLILASASPRRAALLRQIGLTFETRPADIDESVGAGESAGDYVLRLALAKARAVAETGALALGADTAVVLDGAILGKPEDAAESAATLLALSGRRHQVLTGVAVVGGGHEAAECVVTEVRFRVIEPWEAQAYASVGEGADKAGGYGVQGIGGIFAESIRGSYSSVVGLPLAETERLLREGGMDTWRERTCSAAERTRPASERGDG